MSWIKVLRMFSAFVLLTFLGSGFARSLPEFTKLVETYGPAVVNISVHQNHQERVDPSVNPPELPEDSPLYDFFRHFFGEDLEGLPGEELPSRSLGSGFIVSDDGFVLTNAHVVEGADEVIVRTSDRREFHAEVVGADERSDIAVLKVDATDLPTVKIGSAKDLKVGEWVLAIGSPFGFEYSATAGIVSAKGRNLPTENYVPFIQTDVAINPGNSGGPLFNLDGEVIGVNAQIYSRTGGFMGLSFAIPIDVAMDVAEQLKTYGHVTRGWLGVLVQDVSRNLAEAFQLSQPMGALITQIIPESPAANAALQVGDVILAFNGTPVPTSAALPPLVGVSPVGEAAKVTVLRKGATRVLDVVIGELPEEDPLLLGKGVEPVQPNRLGLVVEDLTAEDRQQLGLEEGGVFVNSVRTGTAKRAGVRAGDILLMLDGEKIPNAAAFEAQLGALSSGHAVAVLVQRNGTRLFLAVRIP